ncbi:RNA polymerase sigma-70 factor, ECF subfamily [bacterium A37T11]|nr:RNA polymerase sigma-70 factor, ECF subfamily [bacterium A37T11]
MYPEATHDEKELLIKLRGGDENAFNTIYNEYKKRMATNLMRILKSRELVDETLQDLFMKLWLNREKIDVQQPIRGYLFRIAENLVADLFRQAARDKKIRAHLSSTLQEAYSYIEERLFAEENRAQLISAIDKLPEQRRKVFVLCKLEEKSYAEVSQLLNISTTTINDHITRANAFLKEHFATQTGIGALFIATLFMALEK